MRKVISYVASDFRKDRIWLRRTKPAKREYQVLIALDDTLSMRDEARGGVKCQAAAYEAMALLSSALRRLEVGSIGILRFGADVELMHDFDQTFTENTGARILRDLTFSQTVSRLPRTMEQVLNIMAHAKQTLTASAAAGEIECQQLVFFVSDGIVDSAHRERVRTAVLDAASKNQLFVLLLIDSMVEGHSIVDRQEVSFEGGDIVTRRYMDDYPFPLYVVVRNVRQLPTILADALKQWFQMLKSD